jgi:hypothetical protein
MKSWSRAPFLFSNFFSQKSVRHPRWFNQLGSTQNLLQKQTSLIWQSRPSNFNQLERKHVMLLRSSDSRAWGRRRSHRANGCQHFHGVGSTLEQLPKNGVGYWETLSFGRRSNHESFAKKEVGIPSMAPIQLYKSAMLQQNIFSQYRLWFSA